jgi:hypothetical protein
MAAHGRGYVLNIQHSEPVRWVRRHSMRHLPANTHALAVVRQPRPTQPTGLDTMPATSRDAPYRRFCADADRMRRRPLGG